jgi:hypothetical protein
MRLAVTFCNSANMFKNHGTRKKKKKKKLPGCSQATKWSTINYPLWYSSTMRKLMMVIIPFNIKEIFWPRMDF